MIAAMLFLVGITTSAAAPIILELVAEVTYPHPASLSAGVLLTTYGVVTFGFIQLAQATAEVAIPGKFFNQYSTFFWLQNALFIICVPLLIFVFKPVMLRTRASEQASAGSSLMLVDPAFDLT
eukprot:CAMPEP_0175903620 /NCGR_PEP_ID=MMETSP0108-20121206/4034_1 /TAXON_ID=195067 ORGANISM="Goniomonas pacifica, Strain CCMP1869" /NCGR_SAMPLE_ID=MMETSP0108 /ASSEMBLY_ACC=CAM_ASM_000204 /LENGTH=122 /DNA_ID=CAMNT_0017225365 /DNA_START=79 /DNA_END=444 /DNA_ORIENTATION=-